MDYIYLTHLYKPQGKIIHEQTHAGLTSIREVIVMLKFLKSFSSDSNINDVLSGEQEK